MTDEIELRDTSEDFKRPRNEYEHAFIRLCQLHQAMADMAIRRALAARDFDSLRNMLWSGFLCGLVFQSDERAEEMKTVLRENYPRTLAGSGLAAAGVQEAWDTGVTYARENWPEIDRKMAKEFGEDDDAEPVA